MAFHFGGTVFSDDIRSMCFLVEKEVRLYLSLAVSENETVEKWIALIQQPISAREE